MTKIKTEHPEAIQSPKKFVEHNKKNYKWAVAQFRLPGRDKVMAEDAALDEELIDEILAIEGQGILTEQH